MKKHLILDHQAITTRTRRIAFQIYETNADEKVLYIVGIAHKGMAFAEKICTVLEEISPLKIELVTLTLDKKKPTQSIQTSIPLESMEGHAIVLVDDVLYTGKTLVYALAHLLQISVKRIKTAVLVNRNHKQYPIKADFKGISLSTSLKEHVEVVLDGAQMTAHLSE